MLLPGSKRDQQASQQHTTFQQQQNFAYHKSAVQ
jgi:hypothetical protein